ncbi:hypothetical protein M426DRAFT_97672 [Hypoxylon sp. CI-4A]|nr:hypothetical protein M426DRAFT_97672 [Hypoxylon sp. CI-4A]
MANSTNFFILFLLLLYALFLALMGRGQAENLKARFQESGEQWYGFLHLSEKQGKRYIQMHWSAKSD